MPVEPAQTFFGKALISSQGSLLSDLDVGKAYGPPSIRLLRLPGRNGFAWNEESPPRLQRSLQVQGLDLVENYLL